MSNSFHRPTLPIPSKLDDLLSWWHHRFEVLWGGLERNQNSSNGVFHNSTSVLYHILEIAEGKLSLMKTVLLSLSYIRKKFVFINNRNSICRGGNKLIAQNFRFIFVVQLKTNKKLSFYCSLSWTSKTHVKCKYVGRRRNQPTVYMESRYFSTYRRTRHILD